MAFAFIGKALFQAGKAGIKVGGRTGGAAAKTLYRSRGAIWQSGVARPARAIYGAGKFAFRHPYMTFAGGAGIYGGYTAATRERATGSETLVKGGVEAGATAASFAAWQVGMMAGAAIGTAIGGPVGTVVGGAAGLIFGMVGGERAYSAVKAIGELGYGRRGPSYGEIYQNRRALTMRQASMIALSRSRRNAFGREASSMHLR
jgi:hypothetical protein